jgi:hypothetical protein
MGKLKAIESGEIHVLGKRCRIGRDATCDVPVEDERVSWDHASLRWTSRGWELRDNGSRNGTYVRGRQLEPRERVALGEGETFAVGVPAHGFTLIDAGPPVARATCTTSGVVRVAVDGVLVLPDDDRAAVSVLEASSGGWMAAIEDASRPVVDREIVMVDGEGWELDLPLLGLNTKSVASLPTLADVTLRFRVSRNEDDVYIDVIYGDSTAVLGPRACHYLLLTLARARLADAGASPGERGWVDRDELCRMLRTEPSKLAVDVYRARNRFEELVLDAVDVIVRPTGTAQLRLGTDRVEVTPL